MTEDEFRVQLTDEQREWFDILISGMRLRKPGNEARKLGGCPEAVNRRFRQFRVLMHKAGYEVVPQQVKAPGGPYIYATYRLQLPGGY